MGKKAKHPKRNVPHRNRSTNPKSSQVKQPPHRPPAIEPPPSAIQTPPPSENQKQPEQPKEKNGKKHFSWKVLGWMISFVFLVIGFLGYNALWPHVVIDSSPGVDTGFISYQFTFANQPVYPVKIISTEIDPIDFRYASGGGYDGVALLSTYGNTVIKVPGGRDFKVTDYTNGVIKIPGGDSVTMKIDNSFTEKGENKINEGSKIIIRFTYELPLFRIQKTDSALFEAGRDASGNPIWIKKPLGQYANYKPEDILWDDRKYPPY